VKHMMMTTVRGRFKDVHATAQVDRENPERSSVVVEIATASVDTGVADRDAHLRGPDFFDAERYPTITFRSTRIEGSPREAGDRFRIIGDLAIRDATMETVLDTVFEGRGVDPWGKTRGGFRASTDIDRREWGLRWNQAIETGGVLVANKVHIEAEVQFVRQEEPAAQPA
ncbi:MAG TPA: YceI family protein, partial [Gemmatimonadaceae bacterium]|nr:YceI family protein [Gemmatimonadaceae bacterium]